MLQNQASSGAAINILVLGAMTATERELSLYDSSEAIPHSCLSRFFQFRVAAALCLNRGSLFGPGAVSFGVLIMGDLEATLGVEWSKRKCRMH